mmetsp:Transcript_148487/g.259527  ORF Transcript_148487/g.259527 Transcript_148487/m.259527 type:complete len:728 (-) Transcript_148487:594-2777(-)
MPAALDKISLLQTVHHTLDFGSCGGREDFHVYPRYTNLQPLGHGGFAYVVGAEDTAAEYDEDRPVVIKKLPFIFKSPEMIRAGLRELTLLQFFNHENILKLKDLMLPFPESNDGTPCFDHAVWAREYVGLYMVLERMSCDLGHLLYTPEYEIGLDLRKFIMYQVMRALKFIHSANVLHRDLKPQNILLNEQCDVKLCDFGSAREYCDSGMTTNVTTQYYRAPELLLQDAAPQSEADCTVHVQYTSTVDVWSVGCIMAELCLGRPLFLCDGQCSYKQVKKIFELIGLPPMSSGMNEETINLFKTCCPAGPQSWDQILPTECCDPKERDLISRMICHEPEQRPTIVQALQHPFMAEYHDSDDEPEAPSPYTFSHLESPDPVGDILGYIADFHPEVTLLEGFPASGQWVQRLTPEPTVKDPTLDTPKTDGHWVRGITTDTIPCEQTKSGLTSPGLQSPPFLGSPTLSRICRSGFGSRISNNSMRLAKIRSSIRIPIQSTSSCLSSNRLMSMAVSGCHSMYGGSKDPKGYPSLVDFSLDIPVVSVGVQEASCPRIISTDDQEISCLLRLSTDDYLWGSPTDCHTTSTIAIPNGEPQLGPSVPTPPPTGSPSDINHTTVPTSSELPGPTPDPETHLSCPQPALTPAPVLIPTPCVHHPIPMAMPTPAYSYLTSSWPSGMVGHAHLAVAYTQPHLQQVWPAVPTFPGALPLPMPMLQLHHPVPAPFPSAHFLW